MKAYQEEWELKYLLEREGDIHYYVGVPRKDAQRTLTLCCSSASNYRASTSTCLAVRRDRSSPGQAQAQYSMPRGLQPLCHWISESFLARQRSAANVADQCKHYTTLHSAQRYLSGYNHLSIYILILCVNFHLLSTVQYDPNPQPSQQRRSEALIRSERSSTTKTLWCRIPFREHWTGVDALDALELPWESTSKTMYSGLSWSAAVYQVDVIMIFLSLLPDLVLMVMFQTLC